MPRISGCHHVAIQTENLDRLIDFYREAFGAKVWGDMSEEGPQGKPVRHAFIDLGGFRFHAFEPPFRTGDEKARHSMFARGHIDHIALEVDDQATFDDLRGYLVAQGVSDGTLTDWGAVRQITFTDPDGMEVEISIAADGAPLAYGEARREPWSD